MTPSACKQCVWWNPANTWTVKGECRRRGPFMDVTVDLYGSYRGDGHPRPIWPKTDDIDWCGDFQQKDTQ